MDPTPNAQALRSPTRNSWMASLFWGSFCAVVMLLKDPNLTRVLIGAAGVATLTLLMTWIAPAYQTAIESFRRSRREMRPPRA